MRKQPALVRPRIAALVALTLLTTSPLPRAAHAQRRAAPRTQAAAAAPRDAEIARMIAEIDARNVERTIRKLVSFGTRNTLSEQDNPVRGIGAARDWLYSEFQQIAQASGGRMTVEKQAYTQAANPPPRGRVPQATVLTNVVATLRGTQPASVGRTYVVSGHYDSMCTSPTDAKCDAPGANDDGSGTAAVLEMARVMARHEFDATIIFMAVAGEEQGLLGSTHFAEVAQQQNMDIEGMFTNDIVGNTHGGGGLHDPHTVRVFSEGVPSDESEAEARTRRSIGGENDSQARQLARFIKDVADVYTPGFKAWLVYRRDRYGRGGDHIPFLERGYAAVRFCEPNENFNHQHQNVRTEKGVVYGDLPEFVDYAYVAQVARLNAAALAALARAPARPKKVNFATQRQAYDTELQWAANTEPDLAGYEVVWRDTTATLWTNARFVGNVNSYTVKGLSKDNYLFGVRAVDRAGHRSPVSYPRPAPTPARTGSAPPQ